MGWTWMWVGWLVFDVLMIACALSFKEYRFACRVSVGTIATLLFLLNSLADKVLGK